MPPAAKITSLESAKEFADTFIATAGRKVLTFAEQFLGVPQEA